MPPPNNSSRHRLYFAAGATGLAIVSIVWFTWWNRPPQMGADEGVFATVDALFTAVRARDERLIGQCEQRLDGLPIHGSFGDLSCCQARSWSHHH